MVPNPEVFGWPFVALRCGIAWGMNYFVGSFVVSKGLPAMAAISQS